MQGLARVRQRFVEFLLAVCHPGLGDHHFRRVLAFRLGTFGGDFCAFDPSLRPLIVIEVLRADRSDAGMGQRELRIERHGVLEHLQRELEILRGTSAARSCGRADRGRTPAGSRSASSRQRLLLLRRERDPQRLGDLPRDFVLHLEDVLHLAVVPLGPERKIGAGVDELRIDAQPGAGAAKAAGQHVRGAELLADLRRRDRLVAKGQHGRARKDLQPADLRKLGDDVFGDAVAEVLVLFHAAEVLEIEHGDRFRCRGFRADRGPLASATASRLNRGRA